MSDRLVGWYSTQGPQLCKTIEEFSPPVTCLVPLAMYVNQEWRELLVQYQLDSSVFTKLCGIFSSGISPSGSDEQPSEMMIDCVVWEPLGPS